MLFISFLFLALAFAAPLDLSLDLDTVQNLTSVDRCSDSPAWQAYAFLVEDCYSAIQRVYIEEVLKKPNLELYEFVADGSYPKSHHPWMRTPVQFTVNSCVLSIVILEWFQTQPVTLPGHGTQGHERTDTATFRDIYEAARVVERDCLLPTRRPGWEVLGRKSSIGVFLWATDSSVNKLITGGETLVNNGSLNILPPNSSSNLSDKSESTD